MWEPIRKQLTRDLSGNIWPQSSQLAEPLWTDPGIKSGISVLELISIQKKRKKKKTAGGELMVEHSPKILAGEEKVTINFCISSVSLTALLFLFGVHFIKIDSCFVHTVLFC